MVARSRYRRAGDRIKTIDLRGEHRRLHHAPRNHAGLAPGHRATSRRNSAKLARVTRRRRERLECPACGWQGVTALGRVRWLVFGLSTTLIVGWLLVALLGHASLDTALAASITIALLSIGLRMLVRGDTCPRCRARMT
jgi:hypothetical protein